MVDFLLYSIENLEKSYELELDTLSKCENLNDLSTIEKKQVKISLLNVQTKCLINYLRNKLTIR